jgi:hypothetical protein
MLLMMMVRWLACSSRGMSESVRLKNAMRHCSVLVTIAELPARPTYRSCGQLWHIILS